MTAIWITAPFDDNGIKRIETIGHPTDGLIEYALPYGATVRLYNHREGVDWHRTKRAALAKAKEYRDALIDDYERKLEQLRKSA